MSLVQWHFASRRHRKVPVTFLFTGAAMLALTACGEKNAYIAPPPPKVVVAQPLQQPVTRYIEVTGNTQSISTVDLEARVQGFLEQINYVDGALVKKDSVLFVIQRNTYEAQLAQAKATLAGNQAAQLNAQIEYDRRRSWPSISLRSVRYWPCVKPKTSCRSVGTSNETMTASAVSGSMAFTRRGWKRVLIAWGPRLA